MKAFQLKIAIKNSKPPIWRRVIVPAGITFSQLSMILNKVMGWSGYHLFEFEFYHLELRIMEDVEDFQGYGPFDFLEASRTYVREYLEQNEWFTYTYDLGDDWQHRVTIEKIIDDYAYEYPMVMKYKGDCPIEDSGGIYGYYEKLDIIEDKNHPEYEDILDWMEMQGYPDEYDMEYVNEDLKRDYFYKWGKGEKRSQRELYEEFFTGERGLNATRKDKNKDGQIIRSGKHKMEDSLQNIADMFRMYGNWQQELSETSLKDIFADYDKADIVDIAKDKGIRGISGCSKQKLIDKLVEHMLQPEVMRTYFGCLQDCEIAEFEKASSTVGLYETERTENLEALMKLYQGAYIGMLTDGRVKIPRDVVKAYRSLDKEEFHKERQVNSYLFCCLKTVELIYGIVPLDIFMQLLATNPEVQLTKTEVREKINSLPPEFSHYIVAGDNLCHIELYPDDRGLREAQGNHPYYIPTRSEILDWGLTGVLPNTKEMQGLKNFLTNRLGAKPEDAEFAARLMQKTICSSCEMSEVLEILEEFEIGPKNERQVNKLIEHINALWNNTRMLLNRGFTPNELAQSQSRYPLVQEKMPAEAEIIPFSAVRKDKIYPNDPCPCGSGKKYKNCCRNKK